ncbi:MAG: hypothetical protein HOQ43_12910, partial [Glycomyces artemisiae]|nr:hypothetical protein [Glycomyces artemisiae]
MHHAPMRRRLTAAAAALTGASLLAACTATATDVPAPTGEGVLADICPSTIVIQT